MKICGYYARMQLMCQTTGRYSHIKNIRKSETTELVVTWHPLKRAATLDTFCIWSVFIVLFWWQKGVYYPLAFWQALREQNKSTLFLFPLTNLNVKLCASMYWNINTGLSNKLENTKRCFMELCFKFVVWIAFYTYNIWNVRRLFNMEWNKMAQKEKIHSRDSPILFF